jgi:glycosyltransferase involved in cell wall biosynthesis
MLLSQAPGVGGGERVVLSALARSPNLEVTVVGYEPVCRFAEEIGLPAIRLELPRAHRLSHGVRLAGASPRIAAIARRVEAEVLYANGSRAMPYGIGVRLVSSLPLVVHHHGLFTDGPVRSLVWALERWAQAIIVPSEASAAPFSPSGKLHVLPNGIDLLHFRPPEDRKAAKRRLGLPERAPVVGTVTRSDPRKGMDAFVRVAERISRTLPEARFLLAGGATFPHETDHYRRFSQSAVRALGDRIVVTGLLEDPRPAFHATDVFLHLSDSEGLPTTAIEAMACGVPLVAYRWGGVTEIVEDGSSGLLVTPGNEAEAAEAASSFLADEDLRLLVGLRGRARCLARFDIDRFVEDLTAIVFSVAKRVELARR